jgi:hypothetical protein
VNATCFNATLAVEFDHVRLERLHAVSLTAERLAEIRLSAAVCIAPTIAAAEALLCGVPVHVDRLDRGYVRALSLTGDVVLDDELALRVNARGPLDEKRSRR